MRPNDRDTQNDPPPGDADEPREPARAAPSWRTIEPPREGELLVVVGPTASGKTELAIRLAERFGGEIINADSVQIYRGYDVGSGKPTAEERARAPHHLVDIADPLVPLDAQTFAELGERAIEDVKRRGRVPIVCGGTFLWIKSLVYGLAPAPPADPAIRARHAAIAEAEGRAALHARLAAVDPESAARLAPNDLVRVSRALEIHELSGKPQSEWFAEHGFRDKRHDARLVGVAWPRETLDERIRARVARWLEAGWIDEVRALLDAGHASARPMGSVGYKQVRALLEGELRREELEDTIVRATRVFVRRQRTWLRDEPVLYVALDA
ncbi:tRNA (adenosine(37)-N6)-dimethylallyltransferase MiaA [Polyangium sp. 15x6]|uniref:tRNA (adenosine(37)-N6)-dimethylallyltransferase MiaA n=1 Tax=Polyangium sp. 15x6 TaxID=3042687 RepID=UPI00249C5A2A|nr:tRNA (adenosine(37)-N6)-dimethylallyltransferase MiaA [Polyangium sp. 15x6]MDI3287618.1 tRNA (adenosine(37)-N6)-dimethylallyltransferase MiaA [Polyangium sp. 15x6]